MKKSTLIVFCVLALIGSAIGYGVYELYFNHRGKYTTDPVTEGLTRVVDGNTLISGQYPSAKITFPAEYEYLGAHKFVLYGVADTEQYLFASAHENGLTKSLIVVQFESLLPHIKGTYDYSNAPNSIDLGGLNFWVDSHASTRHWLVPNGLPGTDGYLHRTFMADKGYPLPKYYSWMRLAYVPEENPREEMLIIYMEDLSSLNIESKDLRPGGAYEHKWPGIFADRLDFVETNFEVQQN